MAITILHVVLFLLLFSRCQRRLFRQSHQLLRDPICLRHEGIAILRKPLASRVTLTKTKQICVSLICIKRCISARLYLRFRRKEIFKGAEIVLHCQLTRYYMSTHRIFHSSSVPVTPSQVTHRKSLPVSFIAH